MSRLVVHLEEIPLFWNGAGVVAEQYASISMWVRPWTGQETGKATPTPQSVHHPDVGQCGVGATFTGVDALRAIHRSLEEWMGYEYEISSPLALRTESSRRGVEWQVDFRDQTLDGQISGTPDAVGNW